MLLVSDAFEGYAIDAKRLAWRLTSKVDTRIEPFSISVSRFYSDNPSPIISAVQEEGIEIEV